MKEAASWERSGMTEGGGELKEVVGFGLWAWRLLMIRGLGFVRGGRKSVLNGFSLNDINIIRSRACAAHLT